MTRAARTEPARVGSGMTQAGPSAPGAIHVPGTAFERMTFENFGFPDSSEAALLIAGPSLALAYRRRLLGSSTPCRYA